MQEDWTGPYDAGEEYYVLLSLRVSLPNLSPSAATQSAFEYLWFGWIKEEDDDFNPGDDLRFPVLTHEARMLLQSIAAQEKQQQQQPQQKQEADGDEPASQG
jgi:hypothetical protein